MKHKIILVGSGWATKGFLDKIDSSKYDIVVISKSTDFVYQHFLSEAVTCDKIETSFNLVQKYPFITFIENEVKHIDFTSKHINTVQSQENKDYDYLILAHGSIINDFNIKGMKENAFFLKDHHDAHCLFNKLGSLKDGAHIAIIGSGLTGTEIMGHLLDTHKYNIHVIDGLSKPLNSFSLDTSQYVMDIMLKNNISTYFNQFVKNIDSSTITTHVGQKINYDLAIWCGGIKIHPLSEKINKQLKIDNKFGIVVEKNLQVTHAKNVFACGDCAYSGYVPSAQVAYQQGEYLAKQFNSDFKKKKDFQFKNKGQVCYVGNKKAVYEKDGIRLDGTLGYIMMKCVKLYIKYF